MTTSSSWSTGNGSIASDYGGSNTGQVYGVSAGTTGVTSYGGLEAQINVTQATGYNITMTSVTATTPAGTSVQPGGTYTATVNFSSTFPISGHIKPQKAPQSR